MKPTLFILATLLLTVPAVQAATGAGDASCAPGGDLPVLWWDVRIHSGTCVGVEVQRQSDAPFSCREERLPPCYVGIIVP